MQSKNLMGSGAVLTTDELRWTVILSIIDLITAVLFYVKRYILSMQIDAQVS